MPGTDHHALETRIAVVEANQARQERMLVEIHAAVVGPTDGSRPGHGAQLTAQDIRIARLERLVLWGGTLYTGALSIVLGAWALRFAGPPAQPPTVIYVQPTPPAVHQGGRLP